MRRGGVIMLRVTNFRKNQSLKTLYPIFFEVGLILSLLFSLLMVKVDFYPEQEEIEYDVRQEVVQMEEIELTRQDAAPPPPPRPPVPVEVPNDEIIVQEELNFEAELNLSDKLYIPPPPKNQNPEESEKNDDEIFIVVEQMPELIGGIASIMNEIDYPEMARMAGIEGRVVVQFVIDENGNVINPKVIRGIGGGCDEEAVRAIKTAKFIPGLQRGIPVKVRYSIPITFSLASTKSSK